MDFDAERQSLLNGTDTTGDYHDVRDSRRSQFGGALRIWNTPVGDSVGAKYVPLDEIDFEKRDWVPYSGWPFKRSELDRYYTRAEKICELSEIGYEADNWEAGQSCSIKFIDGDAVTQIYKLGSSAPFLETARRRVAASSEIDCLLWATAIELVPATGTTRIKSLTVLAANKKRIEIRATIFVLAAGGIENPRLLLASNRHWPAGVGNSSDLVGRFLMDHPIYYFTELVPDNPGLFQTFGFYDVRVVNRAHVLGRLTLTEETLRKHRLLNLSVVFYPKRRGYRSRGVEALRQIRFRLRGQKRRMALELAPQLCGHAFDVAAYAWRRVAFPSVPPSHFWSNIRNPHKAFQTFEPEFYLEQPPDPANRVFIAPEKDSTGLPKTLIRWEWGEQSKRSAEKSRIILDSSLQGAGIGSLRLLDYPRVNPSAHHHLGTTRMHDAPTQGVVNVNCRVHETNNLYVVGGSVFPTGGFANPTLTIVALSIKLSDHLKKRLQPPMVVRSE